MKARFQVWQLEWLVCPHPYRKFLCLNACTQEDLIGRKRFLEAARILLDYHKDIRGALVALVQGNDVSEALRVVRRLFS